MLGYLGLPVAASTHAGEIDHMIVLVHWLMLVMFVGWGLFFLLVLLFCWFNFFSFFFFHV